MIWLENQEALSQFLQKHAAATQVVMDTEFIRERTYYPELALVQLGFGEDIALIDPLEKGIAELLVPLLSNPNVLKIMHSCSEDLQAFKAGCGVVPRPVFDTQVAAALCGLGSGLSYLKLVEQICAVTLEKGETRSNWLQRPLTDSQKHYAADDVRYLQRVFNFLENALAQLERRTWLDADCARAADLAANEQADANPQFTVRSNQPLDQASQLRLRRILRWRDSRAVEKNRPKRWIIDNDAAFALCRAPIADVRELDAILARYPKSPKGMSNFLFVLLQKPFDAEELRVPLVNELNSEQKTQLKKMQARVAEVAQTLNVPEGLLCSRKHLEWILQIGTWPEALQGWREPLLKYAFSSILN